VNSSVEQVRLSTMSHPLQQFTEILACLFENHSFTKLFNFLSSCGVRNSGVSTILPLSGRVLSVVSDPTISNSACYEPRLTASLSISLFHSFYSIVYELDRILDLAL
jgi:hypothetical protein